MHYFIVELFHFLFVEKSDFLSLYQYITSNRSAGNVPAFIFLLKILSYFQDHLVDVQ